LRLVEPENRSVPEEKAKLRGDYDQHKYYPDAHVQRKCAKIHLLQRVTNALNTTENVTFHQHRIHTLNPTHRISNISIGSDNDVWWITDRCHGASDVGINHHSGQDWDWIQLHHLAQSDGHWSH
jgi:hypothetical protein